MPKRSCQAYNKWQQNEDDALLKLINQNGCKKWKLISKLMRQNEGILNRTGKQCRERWLHHFNAKSKQFTWTQDDDRKLFRLYGRLGSKWCEIVKHFPNNCDSFIKNRFYSLVRKSIRKMCKFSSVKTTSLNIYNIKPVTLAFIIYEGDPQRQAQEKLSEIYGNQQSHHYYKSLSQLIKYFIFEDNGESKSSPTSKKVLWALNHILEIDSSLQSPRDKYKCKQQVESISIMEDDAYIYVNSLQQELFPIKEQGIVTQQKICEIEEAKFFKSGKNKNTKENAKQNKQVILSYSSFKDFNSNFYVPQIILQSFRDISYQDMKHSFSPKSMIMLEMQDEYQASEDSFVRAFQDEKRLKFKIRN